MPFGLKGAPATFQRLVDDLLDGSDFAAAYIDDVVVPVGMTRDCCPHYYVCHSFMSIFIC